MAYNLFFPFVTFRPHFSSSFFGISFIQKEGRRALQVLHYLNFIMTFWKAFSLSVLFLNLLTLLKGWSSVVMNKSPSYPRHLREVWLRGCGFGWVETIPDRTPEDTFPESSISMAIFKSHEPTVVYYIHYCS